MHCVLIADLASLLSEHGPAIIRSRQQFASKAVADYWATSRNRFELWHQSLARYRRAEESGDYQTLRDWWREHVMVMEEVLVTEILTRVVAAIAAAAEAEREVEEISPVTHAVQVSHVEARNRVQRIMLFGRGNSIEDAVRLNRLRQTVERWTDAMIGRMVDRSGRCLQYAFEPSRAAIHYEDLLPLGQGATRRTAMWLMNASMHDALRRRTCTRTALPEANRRVAQSVMRMLPSGLFDGLGTLKSIWLHQLESTPLASDQMFPLAPAGGQGKSGEDSMPGSHPSSSDHPHFERWHQ